MRSVSETLRRRGCLPRRLPTTSSPCGQTQVSRKPTTAKASESCFCGHTTTDACFCAGLQVGEVYWSVWCCYRNCRRPITLLVHLLARMARPCRRPQYLPRAPHPTLPGRKSFLLTMGRTRYTVPCWRYPLEKPHTLPAARAIFFLFALVGYQKTPTLCDTAFRDMPTTFKSGGS